VERGHQVDHARLRPPDVDDDLRRHRAESGDASTFGEALDGPLTEIIVRNWGVLIALIGAMLVYGAFNPPVRRLVLVVAGVSKIVFITLVLLYGQRYLGSAGLAVGVDLVMVGLFAAYLAATRHAVAGREFTTV
jgi:hypothetical protein